MSRSTETMPQGTSVGASVPASDRSSHGGYDHAEVEPRIRRLWDDAEIYRWDPDRKDRPKWFVHSMFPYPSGDLHIGHWFAFCGGDAAARFKRMEGYNVLHPQGFDAFGLPAENAAIAGDIHPSVWTYANIDNMRSQFKLMGNSYDWTREIITCDPEYYKWNQYFFLKFLENDLAYRSDGAVNWCPKDQTTLANEQVKDGKCERCEAVVVKRNMPQWYFAITKYADDLLETSDIDWPEKVNASQRNWIGRSEGVNIKFDISHYELPEDALSTFTTRIDTIFGVTFVVLAPEHPLVDGLTQPECADAVNDYVAAAQRETEIKRTDVTRDKTGVRTGAYCINPLNGEKVPIFVGDYVLVSYGTGAVMGVPAHDTRDFEFAQKYDLPIRVVVAPGDWDGSALDDAYLDPGIQVNSGRFDGMSSEDGKEAIADAIEENGWGERQVTYHLRDWLISRQRYWGTPIPIVYCDECGTVPVPYEDLPVELPADAEFQPSGKSPLMEHERFLNVACPNCEAPAKRETDTMDTFMDSSWYHMRYLSPDEASAPFDPEYANSWAPVDQYTGGMEHAVMHLLYARFFNRAMRDLGIVDFPEPYLHLFSHGTMVTEEGRISKRSNPLPAEPLVDQYGSDTMRCYLMFLGPWDQGGVWTSSGINGIRRWLNRVWDIGNRDASELSTGDPDAERELERASHVLTKRVIEDMRAYKFNTTIAALMSYVSELYRFWDAGSVSPEVWRSCVRRLLLHIAPLAPHLAEELWSINGWNFSIHEEANPEWEAAKIAADVMRIVVQVNGRVRGTIEIPSDAETDDVIAVAIASDGAQRHLQGAEILRKVYVPNRLVNLVVR